MYLPFPDQGELHSESIDCVVLTEVLEHLYEPKIVLKEIHRILKPHGIIIGTVPFVVSEHEQPYDFYRYSYFCLEKMFRDASFDVIKLDYIGDNIGTAIAVTNRIIQSIIGV